MNQEKPRRIYRKTKSEGCHVTMPTSPPSLSSSLQPTQSLPPSSTQPLPLSSSQPTQSPPPLSSQLPPPPLSSQLPPPPSQSRKTPLPRYYQISRKINQEIRKTIQKEKRKLKNFSAPMYAPPMYAPPMYAPPMYAPPMYTPASYAMYTAPPPTFAPPAPTFAQPSYVGTPGPPSYGYMMAGHHVSVPYYR